MVKVIEYRKTFPAELIEKLVDCGYKVKIEFVGRNIAEPYRCEFMSGKSEGYRSILKDFQ